MAPVKQFLFIFFISSLFAQDPVARTLYLEGDVIYWQPEESGLNYALTNVSEIFTPTDQMQVNNGKVLSIRPSWDLGFKVALGYCLPFDEWDVKGTWTRFVTDKKESASGNGTIFLSPLNTLGAGVLANQADQASSHWSLQYNTADLDLSRIFLVSDYLSLTPILGLKAAWIDQRVKNNYHFVVAHQLIPNIPLSQSIINKIDFWGLGSKIGINGNWRFACDWSVYSNNSFSLLWGKFHLKHFASGGAIDTIDIQNSPNSSRFFYQIALGLKWDTILHNKYRIEAHVGWEEAIWFGMNRMLVVITEPFSTLLEDTNEDLTFHGLTGGISFDF